MVADGFDPDGAVTPKKDGAESAAGAEPIDGALEFAQPKARVFVRIAESLTDFAQSCDDLGVLSLYKLPQVSDGRFC
ncbi:MAG: hypothetical protein WC661_17465 [Opitutaceae bacterium]